MRVLATRIPKKPLISGRGKRDFETSLKGIDESELVFKFFRVLSLLLLLAGVLIFLSSRSHDGKDFTVQN